MPRFTKKPVTIDAWQIVDCRSDDTLALPQWLVRAVLTGDVSQNDAGVMSITTLEGVMTGSIGDWVVRGTRGELYPVKAQIFVDIYEAEVEFK